MPILNYAWNPNIGAVNGYGNLPPNITPQTAYSSKIAATTDTTLTVPSLVGTGQIRNTPTSNPTNTGPLVYAVFGYQAASTVWVSVGATAAPSETNAFVANNSIINPSCFLVQGGQTLHFYSDSQVVVSVVFYPWEG